MYLSIYKKNNTVQLSFEFCIGLNCINDDNKLILWVLKKYLSSSTGP